MNPRQTVRGTRLSRWYPANRTRTASTRATRVLSTVAIGLLALLPEPLRAQCDSCTLQLRKVAELSSEAAAVAPSLLLSVARLSPDRYAVSHLFQPPAVLLYSGSGTLMRSYIRRGSGPGEFTSAPWLFPGNGDTIYALDRNRLVRLDAGLAHLDTRQLDMAPRATAVVLPDGSIVIDARQAAAGGRAYAVQILGGDGRHRLSVEPIDVTASVDTTLVAPALDEGFWTLSSNGSHLRHYSAAGVVCCDVDVHSGGWFEPWSGALPGEGVTVKPRTHRTAVRQIADTLALVLTWAASADWQPVAPAGTQGSYVPARLDLTRVWDSTLELVSTKSGEVIQTLRSTLALVFVQGATDLLFTAREAADGHTVAEIWKVDIRF